MEPVNNVGILLPTRGVLVYAQNDGPRVELNWQMAETAERVGYHSVWVGDSITSKPRLEPLTVMAALAARTHRVKIGTAVMLNALRHPVHLAHAVATIDQISAGRVVLGVGAGRSNNQMFVDEHSAVGVPIQERAARMEESIKLMRALWTQEQVSSSSEFYPIQNVALEPKPVQKSIPIWISSNWVQRGLKRVAELGDAWITNVPSLELFEKCWQKIEDRAGELGRDPDRLETVFYLTVNVDPDLAKAESEANEFLTGYYGANIWGSRWGPFGGPERVKERMAEYAAAGAETLVIRFASFDPERQLDIFLSQVAPAFQ